MRLRSAGLRVSPELSLAGLGLGALLGVVACSARHPVQAPEKAPTAAARPAAPLPVAPPKATADAGDAAPLDAAPADAAPAADASTGYVFEPYESDEDLAEDRRSEKRLKGPAEPPWLFRGGVPKGFRAAQVVFWKEEHPRRAGRFHQQFRKCWKPGGVLDARVLVVTDDKGRMRAYFEEGGNEDAAATLRYFYDAHERLRLLYVEMRDVYDGSYQWAVALDTRGAMLGCRMRTAHVGGPVDNLCEDEVDERPPPVASSVRGAVRVPPEKRKATPDKWRTELLAEAAQPLDKRCPPP